MENIYIFHLVSVYTVDHPTDHKRFRFIMHCYPVKLIGKYTLVSITNGITNNLELMSTAIRLQLGKDTLT